MDDKRVQELLDKMAILDKSYDLIRYVDPKSKKVIHHNNNAICELSVKCFNFWSKDKICDNCISIRAFNENKTYMKVVCTTKKIYMVTAIPYNLGDRKIVIELIKDVSNTMFFEFKTNTRTELYKMIEDINDIAMKDPLTGVYNRQFINDKLQIDIISAAHSEQDISIIMADIDFFKKVNDTYGHLAGDEVLKSFTRTISSCIKRKSDWISRFGGEEFLICLPGASCKKAVDIAEKMRTDVENNEILVNNNLISITVSFGVCTISPTMETTIESIIEFADKKLYAAKNNGRNRVEY